jgi:hypothetical protein
MRRRSPMTTRMREKNSILKWVHVRADGYYGFQTVVVWAGETVEEFKQLLRLGDEVMVTVPTAGLPLPAAANLFDYVKNFDTVRLHA